MVILSTYHCFSKKRDLKFLFLFSLNGEMYQPIIAFSKKEGAFKSSYFSSYSAKIFNYSKKQIKK